MMLRWVCLAIILPAAGWSQTSMPVDPLALLRYLLGPDAAFTASGVLTGISTNDEESFVFELNYAVLQRRIRTESDLSKMRGAHACDNAQDHIRDVGMDQIVSIIDPELKRNYTVYPRAGVYLDTPLDWRERLKEIADVQKTALGPDTVGGHPCIKYRVFAVDQIGDESELLVWEATNLNRFPIQMRYEVEQGMFTMRFSNVKLAAPDITAFQPPAEFCRYTDLSKLTHDYLGR